MSYYHYTYGCALTSIVKVGAISTSRVLIESGEKPMVWLTKSPVWEPTCNASKSTGSEKLISGKIYSSNESHLVKASYDFTKKEIGMCRILISESVPAISWAKLKHAIGIPDIVFNAIDKKFRKNGSPVDDWLCSFTPIPKKYWEGIEMFVVNQWVRWDEITPIETFIDICLNCNGKTDLGKPIKVYSEQLYKQVDFMIGHESVILELWEVNKGKEGYIEVHAKPDYTYVDDGIKFIEKGVDESTFQILSESKTQTYALVHFFFEATDSQYKFAIAYEKVVGEWSDSILN